MLQDPAKPAQVQFSGGALSIQADNSSLQAILQLLSSQSGMQIQGLGQDERVFGNFGPGTPREVLSDLLNGTPYNLLMVGDLTNGAPRQLILSPASSGAAPSAGPSAPAQPQPDEQAADDEASQPPQPPRPSEVPQPGTSSQTIKTPQQLFEELQAMRQRQQSQAPQ
jgi:hypothetical protein